MRRIGFGTLLTAMLLACGGAGGLGGPGVSDFSARTGEYLAQENEIECPVYHRSQTISFGDWSYTFDAPIVATGENSLPWISNSDERREFSQDGVKALVTGYHVRNEAPVKEREPTIFQLRTTDGEAMWAQPYNSGLWGEHHEQENPWDQGAMPPGTFVPTVRVFAIAGGFADDAAMYLKENEELRDDRGRKYTVVKRCAVVDLGKAQLGTHVNPDKAATVGE